MKLTYYGHSCFILEEKGFKIALDPYTGVPGYKPLNIEANEVYCSHGHDDHNFVEAVKIVKGSDNPFKVTEIASYHDDKEGSQRGPNTIRIFEAGGFKIAHMGDIGCELTKEQMEMLNGLNVMLVPVGGFFTIDAVQAKKLADELKPGVVIPMHYRLGEFDYPVIGELADFTKLCDDVKYLKANTAELKGDEKDQIWVMEW